jgi:hypothetical protein
LYLPDGFYALAGPGKAIWGNVPDSTQLPGSDFAVLTKMASGTLLHCIILAHVLIIKTLATRLAA